MNNDDVKIWPYKDGRHRIFYGVWTQSYQPSVAAYHGTGTERQVDVARHSPPLMTTVYQYPDRCIQCESDKQQRTQEVLLFTVRQSAFVAESSGNPRQSQP